MIYIPKVVTSRRPRAISKTLLGHACELRMYKDLTGEPWDLPDTADAQEDDSPSLALIRGRAYHQAVAAVHRVWARPGGAVALTRLPDVYARAWNQSGGQLLGPPDPLGLEWLQEYANENPWFGSETGRRLQDVEITLRASVALADLVMPARDWLTRVDAIAIDRGGAPDAEAHILEAWEFSTAISLDIEQLELQSYCVQLALARSPQLPGRLRCLRTRVMIGQLRPPFWVLDATLDEEQFAVVGQRVRARLERVHAGDWAAAVSLNTCRRCPYRRSCAHSLYGEPTPFIEGAMHGQEN